MEEKITITYGREKYQIVIPKEVKNDIKKLPKSASMIIPIHEVSITGIPPEGINSILIKKGRTGRCTYEFISVKGKASESIVGEDIIRKGFNKEEIKKRYENLLENISKYFEKEFKEVEVFLGEKKKELTGSYNSLQLNLKELKNKLKEINYDIQRISNYLFFASEENKDDVKEIITSILSFFLNETKEEISKYLTANIAQFSKLELFKLDSDFFDFVSNWKNYLMTFSDEQLKEISTKEITSLDEIIKSCDSIKDLKKKKEILSYFKETFLSKFGKVRGTLEYLNISEMISVEYLSESKKTLEEIMEKINEGNFEFISVNTQEKKVLFDEEIENHLNSILGEVKKFMMYYLPSLQKEEELQKLNLKYKELLEEKEKYSREKGEKEKEFGQTKEKLEKINFFEKEISYLNDLMNYKKIIRFNSFGEKADIVIGRNSISLFAKTSFGKHALSCLGKTILKIYSEELTRNIDRLLENGIIEEIENSAEWKKSFKFTGYLPKKIKKKVKKLFNEGILERKSPTFEEVLRGEYLSFRKGYTKIKDEMLMDLIEKKAINIEGNNVFVIEEEYEPRFPKIVFHNFSKKEYEEVKKLMNEIVSDYERKLKEREDETNLEIKRKLEKELGIEKKKGFLKKHRRISKGLKYTAISFSYFLPFPLNRFIRYLFDYYIINPQVAEYNNEMNEWQLHNQNAENYYQEYLDRHNTLTQDEVIYRDWVDFQNAFYGKNYDYIPGNETGDLPDEDWANNAYNEYQAEVQAYNNYLDESNKAEIHKENAERISKNIEWWNNISNYTSLAATVAIISAITGILTFKKIRKYGRKNEWGSKIGWVSNSDLCAILESNTLEKAPEFREGKKMEIKIKKKGLNEKLFEDIFYNLLGGLDDPYLISNGDVVEKNLREMLPKEIFEKIRNISVELKLGKYNPPTGRVYFKRNFGLLRARSEIKKILNKNYGKKRKKFNYDVYLRQSRGES